MKKKLLSLALVLVMALTLLPTAAFAADPDDLDEATILSDELPVSDPVDDPVETADCEHEWSDGTCTKCQEVCDHGGATTGTCNICQKVLSSSNDGNTNTTTPEPPATNPAEDTCTKSEDCTATTHEDGCPKKESSGGDTPTTPPAGHTHTPVKHDKVEATCGEAGQEAYYSCTCGLLFSDAEGKNQITSLTVIPATEKHTPGTISGNTTTTHTYTCTVCNKEVTKDHEFESGVCTVCNFKQTTPEPSSRYVDISSASVNRYSISVTWYSAAPSGTAFDIYVDGRFQERVRPSRSSAGYFSATVDFSYYLDDSYYNVTVYLASDNSYYDSIRVSNRYYDHDYPYYRPGYTPSTNSSGIPYASQVRSRSSASEAIRILRNKNSYDLQRSLMSSSSDRSSYKSLDEAVQRENSVRVSVNTTRSGVPSALRSGVKIVGAAFNASSTNSTVSLVLDAPSQTRYTGHGYQFSMSLTGVGGDYSLDVPVLVTLPLPSDINANYVRVLHYHGSGSPTVIDPLVSGRTITFPLTGFSDFVITDNGAYYTPTYVSDGYGYVPAYAYTSGTYVSDGYGYTWVPTGAPSAARRNLVDEHLQIILPILASTPPSGYVYNDVPGTYWAATPIAWAKDIGIMSGYSDGNFRPASGTTRQELWMVLARLAGAKPADMWAARQWAMSAGITDGSNPHSPLSTQQMIAMLYRYAQYRGYNTAAPANLSLYRDGSTVSPYARTAMSWAANLTIVRPDANGCLNPENIATRADFATYLYRFLA